MKKIYSLLLAAGVAVSTLSANPFTPVSHKFSEKTMEVSKLLVEGKLDVKASSFRAPAAAESTTDAPASLKSAMFKFSIIQDGETYNLSSNVTFTEEEVDEENGVIYYTMNNFLDGLFNGVTVPDLEVAYLPSFGVIYLFGNQDFITFPLTDGTEATCSLWAANTTTNGCVCANYCFIYSDGTFTMENPIEVLYEGDEEPTEFTADAFLLGRVNGQSLSWYVMLGTDFSFTPVYGGGNMTFTMDHTTEGATPMEASVAAAINGTTLTVYNFADFCDVPMTIDSSAKTLTAKDVQVEAITDYKAYLSAQAPDGTNASGSRVYELVSTYSVSGGETTIDVPDWNAFFYQFGVGESYYFYPMIDTTIVLDFDLDEAANAGVETIAADAVVDANAPVEYFNLQGIRVANPEAGQLLIKRQGNKASKVVIR